MELLFETGIVMAGITLMDVYISGVSGLDSSFPKEDRNTGTFTVTLIFNNIKHNFGRTNYTRASIVEARRE